MKICGVDDAGRGSMIGPMVIAGISIENKNTHYRVKLFYSNVHCKRK